jgi:hypothetical protein
LHAELAVDHFELRSADVQEQLLDGTVKAYTDALKLTRNRFDGGAAPKSDVAQAQTQLDGARAQDSDITVMRSQFEHAIATLIGKPPCIWYGLRRRQESISEEAKEIAWKAQHRLHKRYMKLGAAGKAQGKIITAVARELLGFIWAIGTRAETTVSQRTAA